LGPGWVSGSGSACSGNEFGLHVVLWGDTPMIEW